MNAAETSDNEGDHFTGRRAIRWAKRVFRLVVLSLVSWGIWRTFTDARDELAARNFSLSQLHWSWLAVSGVSYALGLAACATFWHRVLRAMRQQPTRFESFRSYFVSHLGKYVPGKAMVVVIRASLVRGERVQTVVAGCAVLVETLTMMAVGACLAAVILLFVFRHPGLIALSMGLMLAAGIPTLPPVFRGVVGWRMPELRSQIAGIRFSLMAQGWGLNLLAWLGLGASLWAVLQSLPFEDGLRTSQSLGPQAPFGSIDLSLGHAALLVACVALAMVAGFLSLIPGGLGVREFVLITLLAPSYGKDVALLSAIILRLIWLVTELLLSGLLMLRRRPP